MVSKRGRSDKRLSARLIGAMVALVLATAAAVGWLTYRNLEGAILPNALRRLEARTVLVASSLDIFVREAGGDVRAVRGMQAVNGIVRATLAGGLDPVDKNTDRQWRRRLALNMRAQLEAKPQYLQFRLIGLADGGREIVRVDREGPSGAVRIAPANDLRQKGEQPYFRESVGLGEGVVYASRIELDHEDGKRPPVIRVATPVRTADGKPFGVLVANIDIRPILKRMRETAGKDRLLYVGDERGTYLIHPDSRNEFGHDLGKPTSWQRDMPDIASVFAENRIVSGERVAGGEKLYSVAVPVQFSPNRRIAVVETLPHSVMMAPATSVGRASLIGGLLAVVVALLIGVVMARSLTRPLEQLTEAVERFDGETKIGVPTEAVGEVGQLARAFETMAGEIQEKTTSLKGLYEIERQYGTIVASSADAIYAASVSGIIVSWNPAAERLLGYSAREAVGRPVDMLVPDEYHAELKDALVKVHAGERIDAFETVRITKAGQRLNVSLTISPVFDAEGKVVQTSRILRDITYQKKVDDRLQQAQKMEAVGNLASGVAHDFNNILAAISGNTIFLRDELPKDSVLQQYVEEIAKAAHRGAGVARQILKIGRAVRTEFQVIPLEPVVKEAVQLLQVAKPANVEIVARFQPSMPRIYADENEIHQVVMNLGINAIHAMRDGGGRLEIFGEVVILDEMGVKTMPGLKAGRFACLSISDTGRGMDRQVLQHIFEPFFTTKEAGEGTGLGLSVVYGIVERHRGAISAYSEVGRGSMFRIYLPVVEFAVMEEPPKPATVYEGQGERVLYVDDDEALVLMIARMLRKLNYEVTSFQSSREALDAYLADPDAFDVVISDLSMPVIDGPEFVRQVRAVRPFVPVVMLTGYIRQEDAAQAEQLGVQRLVLKPNTVHDLSKILHGILANIGAKGA